MNMPLDLNNRCTDIYLQCNCDRLKELASFFGFPDSTSCSIDVSFNDHIYQAVHDNCEIIDRKDNWSQLGFLEAFYIRNWKPIRPFSSFLVYSKLSDGSRL